MNKFLIVLCALFITGIAYVSAQTSSGNMMIGGGLTFASESSQAGSLNDESAVAFFPSFGYFISDNLSIGATLALVSGREGTGSNKTVTSAFGIGPFARYYLFTSNDQFAFFGQGQLSYSTSKSDPPIGNVAKGNAISFALSPGAAFFFNEHWAVEFSITGFVITSSDPNTAVDDNNVTTVELGLSSLSPSLGFRYHF